MESMTYELKYCERCGNLGVRRTGTQAEYCEPCRAALLRFDPAPRAQSESKAKHTLGPWLQAKTAQLALQDLAVPAGRVQ